MKTSVRKTLKTLVSSVQNRSISSEICPENNHKIDRFLPIAFCWSLPRTFPWYCREIGQFFPEFVPKNPAKFDFLNQKPCIIDIKDVTIILMYISTCMLWFNFILLSFIFFCYYHTLPYPKTKDNRIWTKDKIEPQCTCTLWGKNRVYWYLTTPNQQPPDQAWLVDTT